MGCSNLSKNKYSINVPDHLLSINVSSIKSLNKKEKEDELNVMNKTCLIKMGDLGFKERYENSIQIVFDRWDWIVNNTEEYVNMLRINGFSDENIQECFEGQRPLTMNDIETFNQFCDRIFTLKNELKKRYKIKNLKVAIIGSSLYGFSNNPLKGDKTIPSNIARSETCDFDFVFIGIGIDELLKKFSDSEDNIKSFQYVNCNKQKGVRYKVKNLEENMKIVYEWKKEMKNFLNKKIRIYFQEGEGNLAPWEAFIELNNSACC